MLTFALWHPPLAQQDILAVLRRPGAERHPLHSAPGDRVRAGRGAERRARAEAHLPHRAHPAWDRRGGPGRGARGAAERVWGGRREEAREAGGDEEGGEWAVGRGWGVEEGCRCVFGQSVIRGCVG